MNNINNIQNIDITMIIPSQEEFKLNNEIQSLVDSIREEGIKEPLLLRPKNGQYEIVVGNKRYEIARLLGFKTVPALIREVDDEVFNQYKMINNFEKKQKEKKQNNNKFINPSPNNNQNTKPLPPKKEPTYNNINEQPLENTYTKIQNRNNNSDIINLSELNKIEYERDDLKMNNEQMNNNLMNNNIGAQPNNQQPETPAFGGRFFPSLEDEPTNMNMGGIQPPTQTPITNTNSNLIDLTDIGTEPKQQEAISNQTVSTTTPVPPQPEQNTQFNIGMQQEQLTPIPGPTDNIISIDNLQNQNQPVAPTPAVEPVPVLDQNIPNYNIPETPTTEPLPVQEQPIPQFDMSQNIAPTEVTQNQPNINIPTSQPVQEQVANNFTQPTIEPTPQIIEQPVPNYNEQPMPEVQTTQAPEPITQQKDITPILNIIKSTVFNLEPFGYKINISEEDLGTSVKLSIEVEK